MSVKLTVSMFFNVNLPFWKIVMRLLPVVVFLFVAVGNCLRGGSGLYCLNHSLAFNHSTPVTCIEPFSHNLNQMRNLSFAFKTTLRPGRSDFPCRLATMEISVEGGAAGRTVSIKAADLSLQVIDALVGHRHWHYCVLGHWLKVVFIVSLTHHYSSKVDPVHISLPYAAGSGGKVAWWFPFLVIGHCQLKSESISSESSLPGSKAESKAEVSKPMKGSPENSKKSKTPKPESKNTVKKPAGKPEPKGTVKKPAGKRKGEK